MLEQERSAIADAEARAVEAVRAGIFSRLRLALDAGGALARRPSDTSQVFRLVVALDYGRLERLRDRLLASAEGRALMRARAAIDSRSVDYDALRALPEHTLGGAYVRALDRDGLDPDLFVPPRHLPSDIAYVAQRARQTHDILHVLTGLGTDIPGEIQLQAFTHGQLGNRTSRAIAVWGTLLYGPGRPRLFRDAYRWFRAGRRARFLLPIAFEDLWREPVVALRARLGIVVPTAGDLD